jgi:hypothetical protein
MPQQRPTPPLPRQHRGRLSDTLVTLAGTPDDHCAVEGHLITIAELSAQHVAAVSYASVTAHRQGAYTTVAASNDIAHAVDQAQYADQQGPCLEALDTGRPLPVLDIAATMRWPGFRDTAYRLGLHTSLSVPLFAGRGKPIAALNLYGHDPTTMMKLTAAVWATYDQPSPISPDCADLDPGGAELVTGLSDAFAVMATIQQAIGVLAAKQPSSPDRAYAILRIRAVNAGKTLLGTATDVITE